MLRVERFGGSEQRIERDDAFLLSHRQPRLLRQHDVIGARHAQLDRQAAQQVDQRIACGNAPTPGTMIPSAARISSCERVIAAAAPTCASAFSTDRRLPIP